MYCIKCGVELSESERVCPLCGTVPYHPDIPSPSGDSPYPSRRPIRRSINRHVPLYLITLFAVILIAQLTVFDLRTSPALTWSYYATGGLALIYITAVLPLWFRHPNPVIFVPCDFVALALYLCIINLLTGGDWFLSFAFPVTGGIGILVTAGVVLLKYLPKGRLYIIGGAFIALGAFMPLMEFLIYKTFDRPQFGIWCMYPLIALVLLGGMLIFLAICRPARETMERKFFL